MKTIGIYLGSTPYKGGAYQYTLSVIKALESFDPSEYDIAAYYLFDGWQRILPDKFRKIPLKKSIYRKILGGIYRKTDRSREGLRRFSAVFNPAVGQLNSSQCDLIIFPAQDAISYQCQKKSLCAIHDLMHRYEPHFKEYRYGEYSIRERHYANICKYSQAILVDSALGKHHVIESYGPSPDRIFILPFIPPYYLFESREIDISGKYQLPERYIFYPARFWEHKNHFRLLEALKILHDQGVDVNLVLAGAPKDNYRKVLTKIQQLCLEKNVFILDYVSNDDMYSLYHNAVSLVFVSLIGPTNIPPLEAMAVGCPAIVSNIYAMPEQTGDAALLVDPKSPVDIAHKISMVWSDETLRQSMIEKGRKQIRKWGSREFNLKFKKIIDDIVS